MENIKVTLRLTGCAIVLLAILLVMGRNPEERKPSAQDAGLHAEPYISYEEKGAAETADAESREPELSYLFEDLDPGREIRVLLSTPAGGYFYDEVEIYLLEHTYSFTREDVQKRGVIRIQAGDGRIRFRQRESESNPALYPGSFMLRCEKQGIYVVNSLPLEKYLTLVVPGEMPSGYPEEALKSQAILARTYAARCMLQPALPEYFADLDDTTGFQVYAGCGESESTAKAVEDTAGSILCAGDSVADVYYFSTSCGQTTTTEAWNRNAVKERSRHVGMGEAEFTPEELQDEETFKTYIESSTESDFESDMPWYRWTCEAEVDPKKLYQRIRDRYEEQPGQVLSRRTGESVFSDDAPADPGKILDISVTGRSPGGCASELTITGTGGDIRIRNEYSIRYVLCDTASEVILQDGSKKKMGTLLPSAFFVIKTGKDRQDVVGYNLVGGGFGHGIGMAQNGAAAMAKAGYDHRQIIAFFYPEYSIMQLQRIG